MLRAVRRRGTVVLAVLTATAAGCAAAAQPRAAAVIALSAAGASVTSSTLSDGALPLRTHPLRLTDLPPPPRGPAHITIDRLHVSAAVVPVGGTTAGQLDLPDSADIVGWYRHGSQPDQPGAVVLAAHVDLHGVRGVFFDLVELRKGDPISLEFAGTRRLYRVVGRRQISKGDVRSAGIFDNAGPGRLLLVTCGGSFDQSQDSYRDNLVVTAVPA